jgi:hypothetical protein
MHRPSWRVVAAFLALLSNVLSAGCMACGVDISVSTQQADMFEALGHPAPAGFVNTSEGPTHGQFLWPTPINVSGRAVSGAWVDGIVRTVSTQWEIVTISPNGASISFTVRGSRSEESRTALYVELMDVIGQLSQDERRDFLADLTASERYAASSASSDYDARFADAAFPHTLDLVRLFETLDLGRGAIPPLSASSTSGEGIAIFSAHDWNWTFGFPGRSWIGHGMQITANSIGQAAVHEELFSHPKKEDAIASIQQRLEEFGLPRIAAPSSEWRYDKWCS